MKEIIYFYLNYILFIFNINIFIYLENIKILDRNSIKSDIITLINELKTYKLKVLNEIKNQWIGWLYPSFLEHTLLELDVLGKVVNDVKLDVISFVNTHNSQE